MTNLKSLFLLGFFSWLIPFVIAFVIFPIRQNDRIFFESIMPVVLAVTIVCLAVTLGKRQPFTSFRDGLKVGLVWLILNIILDQLFFSWGPMKMSFTDYWKDIGFTYLMIPIITTGLSLVNRS